MELRMTGVTDGDLAVGGAPEPLAVRRRAVVDAPWTWLRQVHGDRVVVVEEPGGCAGEEADAAVTGVSGAVLAVHTADCAPLALVSAGALGVVHAGWRGLAAGVVERTVEAVTALGGPVTDTVLGPCIGPECYEFGENDLAAVVAAVGPVARGRTSGGAPALDLPAAVAASLARAGAPAPVRLGGCTACEPGWYSHRARADAGRQALVAWQEPA
ncbi:MAG: polyphenol oxidase family protein [Acidimicrobiales bacterium]|nr:polyphenol oxidase family protein [Acidimicrobiales bacterium]